MLAKALSGAPTEYSTRKGHAPPGYSREAWKTLARTIGTKRGRWYFVDAATLAEYEAPTTAPTSPPLARAWSPREGLGAAGLRRSG
jgi:hypothetical protein